jgi:hypothetical protein
VENIHGEISGLGKQVMEAQDTLAGLVEARFGESTRSYAEVEAAEVAANEAERTVK